VNTPYLVSFNLIRLVFWTLSLFQRAPPGGNGCQQVASRWPLEERFIRQFQTSRSHTSGSQPFEKSSLGNMVHLWIVDWEWTGYYPPWFEYVAMRWQNEDDNVSGTNNEFWEASVPFICGPLVYFKVERWLWRMSPGLYFSRMNMLLYRPDSDSIEAIVWYDNLMLIHRTWGHVHFVMSG
jgi:hypothetical protein